MKIATYYEALNLVQIIDENLERGHRHYRTKAGRLLNTLDEVVQAILADELMIPSNPFMDNLWFFDRQSNQAKEPSAADTWRLQ